MTKESACRTSTVNHDLRFESVPFETIPGQSRLFLKYQSDPGSLRQFYPNAVRSIAELGEFAPRILANYQTDRTSVCDALVQINVDIAAGEKTFENIEMLRDANTVAVLTGQQAGLFSGPLYTIYKALSAAKLAEELNVIGISAVPIFWAATEDHDFDEVAVTDVVENDGSQHSISYEPSGRMVDSQVGSVELDDKIIEAIEELVTSMSVTEFTDQLREQLSAAWHDGSTFGRAFLSQLSLILGRFGLIFVDPQNAELKRLSAPVYADAISCTDEIAEKLVSRSKQLVENGFHAQVLVEDDYFPLFWQTDDGVRSAIRKIDDGIYRSKADKRKFTVDELLKLAKTDFQRFSPGVMLRPVVQDHLFPTICYFGGGAEIAYFAQNSVIYQTFKRHVTTVMHRQSFTVIEARHQRTLADYGLEFADLFSGIEHVLPEIVGKYISPETAALFADVEEKVNTELNRLDQNLSALDITLAANLAKRRGKMLYHIAALKKKAYRAELLKSDTANRRLNAAFSELFPNDHLQERSINVSVFLNKYGYHFIDWLYGAIDLDERGHLLMHI